MNKLLPVCTLLFSFLFSGNLFSQAKTEYLDEQMTVVADVAKAKYVRDVTLIVPDSNYSVVVKYITGEKMMQGVFTDKALDIEHGDFTYWYANGNLESQGRFKEGNKVGTWKRWSFDGQPRPDRVYPDEVSPVSSGPSVTGRNTIPAKFPGGMAALQKWVNDSLVYPEEAKRRGIEGTVYVSFIIDSTGEIRLPEVSNSVHYLLDEEALRFVTSLPSWQPASRYGTAVESNYALPIIFNLGGSGSNGTSGHGSSDKN